jgi:hypothetical protein
MDYFSDLTLTITEAKVKQYIWIGAVLAAIYGGVLLVGQLKGCAREQTNQAAITHPATTNQVVTHTVTHRIQKPGGVIETTVTHDTGSVSTSIPVVPSVGNEQTARHGYISLTGGYGEGNLFSENYGVGIGWYLTNNVAVGARYDRIGKSDRYAVEATLSF